MDKKQNQDFMELLLKLEIEEVIGVGTILGVNFLNSETEEPKDFGAVFSEMVEKFSKANRKRRRELIKIMRAASSGDKNNA